MVETDLSGTSELQAAPAYPLRALTTRETSDPTIALLDAWAVVADVLTFYRERLTNDGYLRTAGDERALREMAALVGFQPRPGVSATAFLAYTLDKDSAPVVVPRGAKAQTVPGPGEQMLTFETDEPLEARARWNDLRPRRERPAIGDLDLATKRTSIALADLTANVRAGDRLLFAVGASPTRYVVREVQSAKLDGLANRLKLTLKAQAITFDQNDVGVETPVPGAVDTIRATGVKTTVQTLLGQTTTVLARLPSSARDLARPAGSDDLELARRLVAGSDDVLYSAWASTSIDGRDPTPDRVHVFRTTASLFGAVAPVLADTPTLKAAISQEIATEDQSWGALSLDAVYDAVAPGGFLLHSVLGEHADVTWRLRRVKTVSVVGRYDYLLSSRVTKVHLETLAGEEIDGVASIRTLRQLRSVVVFTGTEPVTPAPDPIETPVAGDRIVLDGLYPGLPIGRWIIVAGERVDILDANRNVVPGIHAGELAMIGAVDEGPDDDVPGDVPHTRITLTSPLARRYKRDTVHIYGNVVEASHGESTAEPLGSGAAAAPGQSFVLKRAPLAFTTAPTSSGATSTETVRVDSVRYERVDSLLDAGPTARAYQLDVDATGLATVRFGDGVHGARLPTGTQNVRAAYRVGLGSAGNVRAEQISLLTTRPLGVTGVFNPLPASGGADADAPEQIRAGAPAAAIGLSPLCRLVSVDDYAAFARGFAGIGHADAVKLADGARRLVHVTVTGANDAHLDDHSDVLTNLRGAFEAFSDPSFAVEIAIRELKALVVEAAVTVETWADWDELEPTIRRRLLKAFGFESRRLGQPARLSEVIHVIQTTRGVDRVDVDRFGGIEETVVGDAEALAEARKKLDGVVPAVPAQKARLVIERKRVAAAQLVMLVPALPSLLVLNRR